MNQETILKSNLLDIIFENRNKEYGAYSLRKYYNQRIGIAVFSMVGLSLIFSFFLLSIHPPIILTHDIFKSSDPDKILSAYTPESPSAQMKAKAVVSKPAKNIPVENMPPQIVTNVNINKPVTTEIEDLPSLNTTGVSQNSSLTNTGTSGETAMGNARAILPESPKPNNSVPLKTAEIMPQYPGGINALLAFLKKNIHSPEEVENGEEVKVEITFVVNYNGKLESFNVIKSGGEVFDNEVLRVLKKMPSWIPGKSNGENVSVYYTIPVKFTTEF